MATYISRYSGAEIDQAVGNALAPLTVDRLTAPLTSAGKLVVIGDDGKGALIDKSEIPAAENIDGGVF